MTIPELPQPTRVPLRDFSEPLEPSGPAAASTAVPLRNFPNDAATADIATPPEKVDWGRRNHLRSTYEALLGCGEVKGFRDLALAIGRSRTIAHRHALALEEMGLLDIEHGFSGLDESKASVVKVKHGYRVPAGPAEGTPEAVDEFTSAPEESRPFTTGQEASTPSYRSYEATTTPVGIEILEGMSLDVSRRAASLDPQLVFRADEKRWHRAALGPNGLLIARAWLSHGKIAFSAPQMARWTGVDPVTVTRRLRAMQQPDAQKAYGVTAHYDRGARRWTIEIKVAVTVEEFDSLRDSVEALENEAKAQVVALWLAVHCDEGTDRARQYAWERKKHREMTSAEYARKKGWDSRSWIRPADPANGRPFRGVDGHIGQIQIEVDNHGWPEKKWVPDPDVHWVDEEVEIVGASGVPRRAICPRLVRGG